MKAESGWGRALSTLGTVLALLSGQGVFAQSSAPAAAAPAAVAAPAAAAPAVTAAPTDGRVPAPGAKATDNPALERRVMVLADLLRCLVCQNQTIADSNAELANDLKNQIREQLGQGRTEEQVIQFMVDRYGDFVLYRPPLKAATVLLWFGPVALIVAAAGVVVWMVRRRPQAGSQALSAQENQAVDKLLGESPKEGV